MNSTTYECKACGEPCDGQIISELFRGEVCDECADCINDAGKQLKKYGPRAGIVGMIKEP